MSKVGFLSISSRLVLVILSHFVMRGEISCAPRNIAWRILFESSKVRGEQEYTQAVENCL